MLPLGGAASVPLPLHRRTVGAGSALPENRPGGLWLSLVLLTAAVPVSPVAASDAAAVVVVVVAAAAAVSAAADNDDGDPAAVAAAAVVAASAVVVVSAVAAVAALPFLPSRLPDARMSLVFRIASVDLVLLAWGEVGTGGRVGEIPIPLGGGWTVRGWRGRL